MSSKEFKSLCDTNDVWKYHYLRTIQSKWKITDDSVHIGGGNRWRMKYLYEFNDGFGKNSMVESYQTPESYRIQSVDRMMWDFRENVKFIKELGCDPYVCYPHSYPPYNRPDFIICNGCMRQQMVEITNAGFVYDKPLDMDGDEYRADIYTKWKEYNKSKGISNVCQDPTHYDMYTLEIPSSCRNFKNYKKVVVKKLLTARRTNSAEKKYKKFVQNSKYKIHNQKIKLKIEQGELNVYKRYVEKEQEKTKRLKDAVDCM